MQKPKQVIRFLRNKGYPDGQQITKKPFRVRLQIPFRCCWGGGSGWEETPPHWPRTTFRVGCWSRTGAV